MPTQEEIYKTEGDKYEALIAREDYQGNIMKALREITPLENRVVYDLGAGTGRLACLLAPHDSKIFITRVTSGSNLSNSISLSFMAFVQIPSTKSHASTSFEVSSRSFFRLIIEIKLLILLEKIRPAK